MDHLLPEQRQQTASAPSTGTTHEYVAPSGEKKEAYENTMRKIAAGIQDDPNYQRIALDTAEKKAWFKSLTFRLWDRQITRYTFMSEALAKYPTHQYEFDFILRGFTFN
jgi:hypothetical protein